MNYNWIDAATPQGRERLIGLMDKGIRVIGIRDGKIDVFFYSNERMGGCYWIGKMTWKKLWDDVVLNNDFHGIEFLDPEQPNEIAALKAENERMRNALLEIEADARAKLAANLPLNSNETMHSVKHGLGQLFENGKIGDIGSVIDAIARTFKGDNDFCA